MPTLSMTSALDITEAVTPPRSAYLHFPLGHPSGKPLDPESQRAVVRAALEAAPGIRTPGEIVRLPFEWDVPGDEGWERSAYTPETVRVGSDGKPDRS